MKRSSMRTRTARCQRSANPGYVSTRDHHHHFMTHPEPLLLDLRLVRPSVLAPSHLPLAAADAINCTDSTGRYGPASTTLPPSKTFQV